MKLAGIIHISIELVHARRAAGATALVWYGNAIVMNFASRSSLYARTVSSVAVHRPDEMKVTCVAGTGEPGRQ